jgi:omega-hydroxy-beta-dihydromenaquinone-9 sulfotransferase
MQMGWDRPQEDEFALCNLGIPSPYATMAFPRRPQFPEYMDLEQISPSERRRWQRALLSLLKQLTYKRPGRLVLKSPPHTCRLPVLLEMFPQACFINMVRDPYKVFMSTVRLWKSLYAWQAYQHPCCDDKEMEERVFTGLIHIHERLEATRGLVAPARFCDLRFEDLLRDPVGRVRGIYEQFGLSGFESVAPAMRTYFEERADYQPNRHELPAALRAEIGRRWRPYFERYGYAELRT